MRAGMFGRLTKIARAGRVDLFTASSDYYVMASFQIHYEYNVPAARTNPRTDDAETCTFLPAVFIWNASYPNVVSCSTCTTVAFETSCSCFGSAFFRFSNRHLLFTSSISTAFTATCAFNGTPINETVDPARSILDRPVRVGTLATRSRSKPNILDADVARGFISKRLNYNVTVDINSCQARSGSIG